MFHHSQYQFLHAVHRLVSAGIYSIVYLRIFRQTAFIHSHRGLVRYYLKDNLPSPFTTKSAEPHYTYQALQNHQRTLKTLWIKFHSTQVDVYTKSEKTDLDERTRQLLVFSCSIQPRRTLRRWPISTSQQTITLNPGAVTSFPSSSWTCQNMSTYHHMAHASLHGTYPAA